MLFLFFFSALCEWGGWVLKSAENSALFFIFETFPKGKFLPPQLPNFDASHAITAATRKSLSTTHTILALTWFCHLSMYL